MWFVYDKAGPFPFSFQRGGALSRRLPARKVVFPFTPNVDRACGQSFFELSTRHARQGKRGGPSSLTDPSSKTGGPFELNALWAIRVPCGRLKCL
jgi:hypothetical protein